MTTPLIAAAIVAAGNPTKSPDGALGLLVFLALAVVVYFLFRSMNKHLRKAQRMKYDDVNREDVRREDDRDASPTSPPRPRR